jgi:pimeloyl-[acyl-carrier protein] methyl ester esterase
MGIPRARLTALRAMGDAALPGFLHAALGGAPLPQGVGNATHLAQGLDWLQEWDARATLAALRVPVLALHSRGDVIVPAALAQASFGEAIEWHDGGSHLLPLTAPQWCAEKIKFFAAAL